MTPGPSTVLIVDDEANLRRTLSEIFEERGYRVLQAASGTDALRALSQTTPDLIFCDWQMPEMKGEDVLRFVRAHERVRDVPLIVITAHGTSDNAIEAVRLGAYDFVTKPFDLNEIVLTAERALEHLRLHREVARLNAAISAPSANAAPGTANETQFIGSTAEMIEVFKRVGRAADSDTTVLVRGESGTGKELVAAAIHAHGPRSAAPFVAVNCAALSDTLLESELFGHEKGAFTGAVSRHAGRFELAQGGTIFLDEIGDVSPALQAKLLRVLQERRFERVGGSETIAADVRVIAATNRDLETAVAKREFREDLYYRLSVFTIPLPPLRSRRADIIPLAEHFMAVYAARQHQSAAGFTADALLALQRYDYPGNVRELENIIERANVMANGRAITPELLALHTTPDRSAGNGSGGEADHLSEVWRALPLPQAVVALERTLITDALAACGGNKAEAARRLGIHRRLLYSKLAEHGLL